MTRKKRGLGRGLDALLTASQPIPQESQAEVATPASMTIDGELLQLSLDQLQPGQYQPRRDIQTDTLEELASSIKSQGLMQPIVVRPLASASDQYEIIAGERRWRASKMAGLTEIPVLIRDVADDAAITMALIENIQRENLNPMEEAIALHRLQQEFDLTQQEVAEAVGKNRTTIANFLRLMNLNNDVKRLLENGDIEMGHARALLGLSGDHQSQAALKVVSDGLSVRQTEVLVRQWNTSEKSSTDQSGIREDPDIMRLERVLGDRLGARVSIQHGAKGKGKLVINYTSLAELDGILDHIK